MLYLLAMKWMVQTMGTKAILVIDMPEKCVFCPVYNNDGIYPCKAINIEETEDYDELTVPAWCPLKPLPKKLEFKTDRLTLKTNMDEIDNYIKNLGYERVGNIHDTIGGFNACLEELLGEGAEHE